MKGACPNTCYAESTEQGEVTGGDSAQYESQRSNDKTTGQDASSSKSISQKTACERPRGYRTGERRDQNAGLAITEVEFQFYGGKKERKGEKVHRGNNKN